MMTVRNHAFTCVECGRSIIAIVWPKGQPNICAACLTVPGWFRDPQVRRIIAGGETLKLPEHERDAG